ncbi:Uncharacterised protein [Burkholderia pseudomallei]|uniref:hypothetical protein n=1 Tax=Burkholderia pseudomallei TaxID=28450 RepID=UPI000F1A22D3|nr:hypothetical protein [Burkholderia pseudomallei]CAJ3219693.1 Uncharacterised protein [Burkholderia pseudomallei]CAJ3307043.1 Uncharacterised protein [Burkholderia pseudomallei]CAJ3917446.1 Uncharacterised protein [Burkholderia pseudomallei]CAJ5032952.1 Uncharacterised protein [Burkholderia pseudomallei]CAJ7432129.1 Uncharacterised protein [Burkholderia pseudomallei]
MGDAVTEADRSERRYRRLAADKLPAWVPDALVKKLADNFASTASARGTRSLDVFVGLPHQRCVEPLCPHCEAMARHLRWLEDERGRLYRMSTYPDMQDAWKAIATRERNGPLASRPWARELDGDGLCDLLLGEIEHQLRGNFAHIPKQSAAEARKSGQKIDVLVRKLIAEIDEFQDGPGLAAEFLGAQLAAKNMAYRAKEGESSQLLAFLPPSAWPSFTYEPNSRESGYDDPDGEPLDLPPWDKLPAVERFRWLCREVAATDVRKLLSEFAEVVNDVANAPRQIVRPGSGDPRVRVLTKALSDWMQGWYGSPFDDVVARFVSAILDLKEPLARDDVRPTRKRASGA